MSRSCVNLMLYCCLVCVTVSCQQAAQEDRSDDDTLTRERTGPWFPGIEFSDHKLEWYSAQLAAMKEMPLNESRTNEPEWEAYRFLWLRSFDRPIAVRFERSKKRCRVIVNELDGKGGYDPGKLVKHETHDLTSQQWTELTSKISQCDFWSMSTSEKQSHVQDNGLTVAWSMSDGAQWIVEGFREGKYHVVDRQSPDVNHHRKLGEYRSMCLYMLTIAGLDLNAMKVY